MNSRDWQKEYNKLTDFLARNPQINITESLVIIPDEVRSCFWDLFDNTRISFILNNFSDKISEADNMSRVYLNTSNNILRSLDLDISKTSGPEGFLFNPLEAAKKFLRDPLMDLIKNKIDSNTFERHATLNLNNYFVAAFRDCYQQLLLVSFIEHLKADEALESPIVALSYKSAYTLSRDIQTGKIEDRLPKTIDRLPLIKLKKITYKRPDLLALVTPDFIFHSKLINSYVAVRLGLQEVICSAANYSKQREWHSINCEFELIADMDAVLVYIDNNAENIALLADKQSFCQPELVIIFKDEKDWYEKEGLNRIIKQHTLFKPSLGTFIVSKWPTPTKVENDLISINNNDLKTKIHLIWIDFNRNNDISPIVNLITDSFSNNNIKTNIFSWTKNMIINQSLKFRQFIKKVFCCLK